MLPHLESSQSYHSESYSCDFLHILFTINYLMHSIEYLVSHFIFTDQVEASQQAAGPQDPHCADATTAYPMPDILSKNKSSGTKIYIKPREP